MRKVQNPHRPQNKKATQNELLFLYLYFQFYISIILHNVNSQQNNLKVKF